MMNFLITDGDNWFRTQDMSLVDILVAEKLIHLCTTPWCAFGLVAGDIVYHPMDNIHSAERRMLELIAENAK